MRTNSFSLQKFVIAALLLALVLLMSFTPVGFIPIGPITITLVHLPVLVGLLCEGLGVGLLLGAAFGIVSMLRALAPTTILSPFFLNPLVSVLPRLLIPLLAWGAYRLCLRLLERWPKRREWIATAVAAAIGTLTNTVVVLLMMYLVSGRQVAETMGVSPGLIGGVLAGIGVSNGVPELIFSVLVVPPLVLAVRRASKRIPKTNQ